MVQLPKAERIFEGVDASQGPIFSVSEVSKIFFDRSPHWIRLRDREGAFQLNGEYVGGYRTGEAGTTGARRYTLADVEAMTYALAAAERISGTQHLNALRVVWSIAEVYELIGEDTIPEEEG